MNLRSIFFKLMNNAVFDKTMENVRTHRDIKLVTTEKGKDNYHRTKFFTERFLAIEKEKTAMLMNKLVYLGLSRLQLSEILMYEFWYQ